MNEDVRRKVRKKVKIRGIVMSIIADGVMLFVVAVIVMLQHGCIRTLGGGDIGLRSDGFAVNWGGIASSGQQVMHFS